MSSGSPLPRFPVPLSAMAQSLRKKGAEDGAGWVTSRTDGVLFLLGFFAVLIKESDVCCFVGGVGWELLSYIQIFSTRTMLGSEQIQFYSYVQVACPPPVVQDQHVLHTPGRHSLWSLRRDC